MVNLISVDTQTLYFLTTYLNIIWSGPFQIGLCLYMLWRYIGVAALAGLATMAVFVPLNVIISNIIKRLRKKKMKITDTRIKTTNELLNGIKV
jgi:ATP-binding cassette subfamily C (CFTR/MRP) protein 1